MRLILVEINDQQKKAFMVVAKAMNVKVKVEKDKVSNIEKEILDAMKNAQLTSQGKYLSRPVKDLLNSFN